MKIFISGFKSIENIEIELGQINIFIGNNGSGKSNILEAIGMLSAAVSGRVDDESIIWRGVRPGLPCLYKSAFKDSAKDKDISFCRKRISCGNLRFGVSNAEIVGQAHHFAGREHFRAEQGVATGEFQKWKDCFLDGEMISMHLFCKA